jgi:hypothetical protein
MAYLGTQPEFAQKLYTSLDTNGQAVTGSGSIDITGTLEGATKIETLTGATVALTAAQCYGSLIICNKSDGGQEFDLPPCAVGMMVTFYANQAQAITVDPDASDKINLSGTDKADGVAVVSAATRGSLITLVCHDAAFGWTTIGIAGNWS